MVKHRYGGPDTGAPVMVSVVAEVLAEVLAGDLAGDSGQALAGDEDTGEALAGAVLTLPGEDGNIASSPTNGCGLLTTPLAFVRGFQTKSVMRSWSKDNGAMVSTR